MSELGRAALAAMWQKDIDHGIDPLDTGDLLHPTAPAPVEVVEPLIRPTPPAPDWRAEQVAAQRSAPSAAPPRRRRRVQWKGPR